MLDSEIARECTSVENLCTHRLEEPMGYHKRSLQSDCVISTAFMNERKFVAEIKNFIIGKNKNFCALVGSKKSWENHLFDVISKSVTWDCRDYLL